MPRPRRSHKKSRQGCRECKRRHLKCDESKPKCVNCVTARLECPYEDVSWTVCKLTETPPSLAATDTGTPSSFSTNTPAISPNSAPNTTPYPIVSMDTESQLNLLHLELLHWWSTHLFRSFVNDMASPKYADTCITNGLRFPFLMRQILATSALNLSITRPSQRSFYHQHATQLQSEALMSFTMTLEAIDESNVIPAFLASSLIGMHSFCETFIYRNNSFSDTLESLLRSMNLLRGCRTVIGSHWEFLMRSELRPILYESEKVRKTAEVQGKQLTALRALIDDADISSASQGIYRAVIEELELVFAIQASMADTNSSESANMIFGWLVIVSSEYTDLLSARRPEALIILSYYAVVLHGRKHFWAIGDAGKYLVDAINTHLGRHWDQWLEWPRSIVST